MPKKPGKTTNEQTQNPQQLARPLWKACKEGNYEKVKQILHSFGNDHATCLLVLEAADSDGNTAWMIARNKMYYKISNFLSDCYQHAVALAPPPPMAGQQPPISNFRAPASSTFSSVVTLITPLGVFPCPIPQQQQPVPSIEKQPMGRSEFFAPAPTAAPPQSELFPHPIPQQHPVLPIAAQLTNSSMSLAPKDSEFESIKAALQTSVMRYRRGRAAQGDTILTTVFHQGYSKARKLAAVDAFLLYLETFNEIPLMQHIDVLENKYLGKLIRDILIDSRVYPATIKGLIQHVSQLRNHNKDTMNPSHSA